MNQREIEQALEREARIRARADHIFEGAVAYIAAQGGGNFEQPMTSSRLAAGAYFSAEAFECVAEKREAEIRAKATKA